MRRGQQCRWSATWTPCRTCKALVLPANYIWPHYRAVYNDKAAGLLPSTGTDVNTMNFNVGNLDKDFTTYSRDGSAMYSQYPIANFSSLLHVARADASCSEASSLTPISKVRCVRLEKHACSASQTNEAGLQRYTPSVETLLA